VVTGSVLSGRANVGDTLELLPQKQVVKIRGLQRHGQPVEQVATGDRAAINLQSIEKEVIERGHVLSEPNYAHPSQRFDANLKLLPSAPRPLKSKMRVRLHFGTTEVMARVAIIGASQVNPGESGYAQFHLEKPAVARRLDPYVIRQFSPTITIGGGAILDANSERRRLSSSNLIKSLQELEKENPAEVLESKLRAQFSLLTMEQLSSETGASKETVSQMIDELVKHQKAILLKKAGQPAAAHAENFKRLKEEIQTLIADFHQRHPTKLGWRKSEIVKALRSPVDADLLDYAIGDLVKDSVLKEESGRLSRREHRVQLSPQQEALRQKIEDLLLEEAFATSSAEQIAEKLREKPAAVIEVLDLMAALELIIWVEGDIYFHSKRVAEARQKLANFFKANQELSVSQFKDLLGTSRKYAVPLLNYFDGLGITERVGDVRLRGSNFEKLVEKFVKKVYSLRRKEDGQKQVEE
jgi:selenocysteine-specific elongation factor